MSRNNRLEIMTAQKEIIEKKKMEIAMKKDLAILTSDILKTQSATTDPTSSATKVTMFKNDGSFLEQFKLLKEMAEAKAKNKSETTTTPLAGGGTACDKVDSKVSASPFAGYPATQDHAVQKSYTSQPPVATFGSQPLPSISLIQTAFPMFNPNIPPPLSSLSGHSGGQQQPQHQTRFMPSITSDLTTINKPSQATNQMPESTSATISQEDNELMMPTSIEQLIELVADIGDFYEEKLLSRKNELDATIWFLANKSSVQYKNYRQAVAERRLKTASAPKDSSTKYDPADVLENDEDCFEVKEKAIPNIEDDTSSDSDTEYMKEAKERNLQNIKRKAADSHLRRNDQDHDTSDTDEEYEMQRKPFFHGKRDSEISSDSQSKTNRTRLKEDSATDQQNAPKRTRWGEKVEVPPNNQTGLANTQPQQATPAIVVMPSQAPNNLPSGQVKLTSITRSDPALLAYARQSFGTIDLSEEDWLKAEEHYKINLLYQDLLKKRQEIDRLAKCGKFKYEYDSDEDTQGGTWEHKLRLQEMEATQNYADALTKQSDGKHFLGDFLPPEELRKFMEQYEAKKNDRLPDLSDYREFKLKEDNIGFQMLQKLGWQEGKGLGTDGSGILDPINKASQRQNQGLGVSSADVPERNDSEYDAYRKRMMLAYRFRPNPLNNPRRAYY